MSSSAWRSNAPQGFTARETSRAAVAWDEDICPYVVRGNLRDYGFCVGRNNTSLTNDCGSCVTSMATTCATSSGCSIFFGSLPSCGLRSVFTDPGQITETRMLWHAQFFRHRIAQAVQSPLRRGVGRTVGQGILSRQGRDVHDVPSAGANHHGGEAAHAVVDAAQVGVHDLLPGRGRHLVQRTGKAADSGVVNQDVDAARLALHLCGEALRLNLGRSRRTRRFQPCRRI